LWRIVPPVVVLAVAIAGWTVGSELGRVPLSARQPHEALPPAAGVGPGQARIHLVWRRPPTTTSFDPAGDGVENADSAGLAVDRDPTTEWTTDTYRGDPHLGGLKPGVGLLLDLGKARRVSVAELVLSAPGATVELRAGDSAPVEANDLPVVAGRHQAGSRVRLNLSQPVTARYWLVWFTSLPPAPGGYRVGVAEVALLG
jgi:putative peptidoglycan lipid II flippase